MRVSPPLRYNCPPNAVCVDTLPAAARISRFQLRGLGQDDSDTETIGDSDITIGNDADILPTLNTLQSNFNSLIQSDNTAAQTVAGLTPAQLSAALGANASGAMTPAQLASIISSSGAAASSILKSTQSPYVIPGTSVVYNPATGQMSSSTGLSAASTEITSMLPIILLAVGAMIILPMLGGKR